MIARNAIRKYQSENCCCCFSISPPQSFSIQHRLPTTMPSTKVLIIFFILPLLGLAAAGFPSPGNAMITVTAPHAGAIDMVAALVPALGVVTQTRPGQEQALDRPRLVEPVEDAMRIPALRLVFPQNPAVTTVAQYRKNRPIDQGIPHRRPQLPTPKPHRKSWKPASSPTTGCTPVTARAGIWKLPAPP